jgi:hypothetical protein
MFDGFPDLVIELPGVVELAEQPSILHVLLERTESIELRGIDIVRQRGSREVQMDWLAQLQGPVHFLGRSRNGVRRW